MKTQSGIWLDTEKAHIVTLSGDQTSSQTIESEVEHFNLRGGYGGANKNLPQNASSEKKLLARKQKQLGSYYQKIIGGLGGSDQILIMGPSEAKLGLKKAFDSKNLHEKIADVVTADKMTPNQLVAKVKEYFKAKNSAH